MAHEVARYADAYVEVIGYRRKDDLDPRVTNDLDLPAAQNLPGPDAHQRAAAMLNQAIAPVLEPLQ